MKKTILWLAIACGTVICSCTKDSEADVTAILSGTWILSEVGVDYNGNSRVDNGETTPASATILYDTLTFTKDDTFTSHYNDGRGDSMKSGTYSYSNNRIYFVTSSSSNDDYIPLTSISQNQFVYNIAGAWHIYSKLR